jgi:hypothetical protein
LQEVGLGGGFFEFLAIFRVFSVLKGYFAADDMSTKHRLNFRFLRHIVPNMSLAATYHQLHKRGLKLAGEKPRVLEFVERADLPRCPPAFTESLIQNRSSRRQANQPAPPSSIQH